MTDQPELYRVQTTAGESVVVIRDAMNRYFQLPYGECWYPTGDNTEQSHPAIDLDTLTRLHLLTDDELQARDAEVLERALKAIADLPTPDSEERMAGHEDAYRAIEAMKGQTHER